MASNSKNLAELLNSDVTLTATDIADGAVTVVKTNFGGSTEAIQIPAGTTAQRPVSPSAGEIRYNSTYGNVEVYNGSSWGIVSTTNEAFASDIVIAAGGGGAAAAEGDYGANGGAGAGGLVEASSYNLTISTSYTVTVGAGGASSDKYTVADNGDNSQFGALVAFGGGGGPDYGSDGSNGGSGAGGSENIQAAGSATQTSPSGATGYGNNGGAGGPYTTGGGGGGGGASAAGQAHNAGRAGGAGRANLITGTTLCAGGSGCPPSTYRNSSAGSANSGNGANGAGAAGSEGSGANGGSGVVIIKYPESYTLSVGGGLTSSSSTSAGYTTTTFTAGTDSISFSI